jgi:hypothetical protein
VWLFFCEKDPGNFVPAATVDEMGQPVIKYGIFLLIKKEGIYH